VPFHTAQLALSGMNEEAVREASWTVQSVVGASAYMHGIDYDTKKFKQELSRIFEHVKKAAKTTEYA
jgi:hypothetical protein